MTLTEALVRASPMINETAEIPLRWRILCHALGRRAFAGAISLILLAVTAPSPSASEACAHMDDDDLRLACYDREYRDAPEAGTAEDATANDDEAPIRIAWTSDTEVSKIDDSTNVFLRTRSTEPVRSRFGLGQGQHATLLLRCMENTTSLYIAMNDSFLADSLGYGDITFRIDDQPAFERSFTVSTDNHALGLWRGGNAIPFIRKLFGGETLLAKVTPFNESPVTLTFPISGLETAVEPLREACHW